MAKKKKNNIVELKFNPQEEVYGLSWQAVAAIVLAFQKGMAETMKGNEFDASECIFDFQLVERGPQHGEEYASDPGLYVVNPPAFRFDDLKDADKD